jgi:hypothetical protein
MSLAINESDWTVGTSMPPTPQSEPTPVFQLCLDDEQLCPTGPIPVGVLSLSGSGLAVLTVKGSPGGLNPAALMLQGSEGRPLRLTARIGQQSISLTAQLVWSEASNGADDQVELIIDATGTTEWQTIVAAYHGAV